MARSLRRERRCVRFLHPTIAQHEDNSRGSRNIHGGGGKRSGSSTIISRALRPEKRCCSMHRVAGLRFGTTQDAAERVVFARELGSVDDQATLAGRNFHHRTVSDLALQNEISERILQIALDHPLQGSRTVDWIVSGL